MDIFKFGGNSAPNTAPQNPTQNPAANTPAVPGNFPATPPVLTAIPGNGTVPADSTNTPTSPLDAYSDMWNTDPTKLQQQNQPLFNVDQQKLYEAAARNDFSKSLSPELLQKIQAGGTEATQAMLTAMNQMTQRGYAESAFATTKIVEQALEKQRQAFEAKLPALIKSQNVSDNLKNQNPIFNHPAAAPMLESLKANIAVKYPNATAQEQQKMAEDYLTSFAQAATPISKTTSESNKASGDFDWSNF